MEKKIYEIAIVGGGLAGYSAALTVNTLRHEFIWFGTKPYGEKLALAEDVRNFPSYFGDGKGLIARFEEQRIRENIPFTQGRIDGIYATGEGFMLTQGQTVYEARSVILATGVEALGSVKGEKEFVGRGVSYCAVCDGALYRGKTVAVALYSKEFEEEAEYLAGLANTVYAFCLYQDKPTFHAKNITVMRGRPLEISGGMRVERIATKEEEFLVDGVFMLKNATPPSALVGGLQTEGAHVLCDRKGVTNLAGLFVAGDVTGRPYQYAKATGEGLVAAYSAHEYLLSQKK